jgi:predicted HTH domain antitoxin
MTRDSIERSVALYRTEGFGLEQAAARAGVPAGDLAAELRERGVFLRPEDARGANRAWS